ncbi:sensor histidine kinase [Luethyella okanaganae]|uniref:histidine kinase n=1 Tax=Luethyella okanaganae TaxID=69372 RepID=A0ABW1VEB4_9MICO
MTTVVPESSWRRPRPDRAGYRRDALVAIVLAGATLLSVLLSRAAGIFDGAPLWQSAVWVACMSLPLAFRRRWPEAAAIIVTAAFFAGVTLEVAELLFSNICLFVAIYSLGAWGRNRARAAWLRGVIVVGMFGWLFAQLIIAAGQPDYLPEVSRSGTLSPYLAVGLIQIITNVLYFGGAYYFGNAAYRSARERHELERRTQELAAERERTQAQAVALERVRIARELHDVVAHHVSVMGVQAGAARRVLDRDPAQAAASLSAIEANAREAVDELHLLLGTLRADEADEADIGATLSTSTRGLHQLDELVADAAAAGLSVTMSTVGSSRTVPTTIGFTAYRIAQEALTNTRKHAGPDASADLRVRYLPDSLELEVRDHGTGTASLGPVHGSGPARNSGLGLIGMRERVAAVGGTLELGPRARGGYLVRARFPLPTPAVAVDDHSQGESGD